MASNSNEPETFESPLSLTVRDVELFRVLTPAQMQLVESSHSQRTFKRNEIIYSEGQQPEGLYILASGKVKIYKEGVGGREQIVKLASPQEFIGYRALMSGQKHIATAMALDPCVAFFLSEELVMQLLRENNELCLFIIKSLAIELGFSRYRSVTLTQKQIRGRLAEGLIVLRDKYGYVDGNTLNANLSREDVANLCNMTTSNAIRTLSNFVSENIIAVNGRTIKILNEPMLERISRLG